MRGLSQMLANARAMVHIPALAVQLHPRPAYEALQTDRTHCVVKHLHVALVIHTLEGLPDRRLATHASSRRQRQLVH